MGAVKALNQLFWQVVYTMVAMGILGDGVGWPLIWWLL